jgi:hypothetical protein
MPPEPEDPYLTDKRWITVWLTGIECQVRQERGDDVHGTVSVIVPSMKVASIHHFPEGDAELKMGQPGVRMTAINSLVHEGPPADIVLNTLLVEHDSGDITKYKEKIAAEITKAAASLGAVAGVPAETMGSSQGFLNDLSLGLVDLLSDWVGAADDSYNPGSRRIPAKDILTAFGRALNQLHDVPNPFVYQRASRPDTPGVVLEHNIDPIVVSGTDDGGDTGRYAFYFLVELFYDTRKVLGRPE